MSRKYYYVIQYVGGYRVHTPNCHQFYRLTEDGVWDKLSRMSIAPVIWEEHGKFYVYPNSRNNETSFYRATFVDALDAIDKIGKEVTWDHEWRIRGLFVDPEPTIVNVEYNIQPPWTTAIVELSNGTYKIGHSKCHEIDEWDSRVGRKIAVDRAMKSDYTLEP